MKLHRTSAAQRGETGRSAEEERLAAESAENVELEHEIALVREPPRQRGAR